MGKEFLVTTKQIALIIVGTTILALALAWLIERTQVRAFMREFEEWYGPREVQPEGDE
jgi:ABC-type Fe3+ transport system permease subunit